MWHLRRNAFEDFVFLSRDEIPTADLHTAHAADTVSVLSPCRRVRHIRPRLQRRGCPVPGAAAGLRVPGQAAVCHHGRRSVHGVRDPGLPVGGGRPVRSHRQETHAARRVCPQRQVPTAILGQELRGVAAVLVPSAELRTQNPAAVGGERQAALAGHAERGCPPLQGGTGGADRAAWLCTQVCHDFTWNLHNVEVPSNDV